MRSRSGPGADLVVPLLAAGTFVGEDAIADRRLSQAGSTLPDHRGGARRSAGLRRASGRPTRVGSGDAGASGGGAADLRSLSSHASGVVLPPLLRTLRVVACWRVPPGSRPGSVGRGWRSGGSPTPPARRSRCLHPEPGCRRLHRVTPVLAWADHVLARCWPPPWTPPPYRPITSALVSGQKERTRLDVPGRLAGQPAVRRSGRLRRAVGDLKVELVRPADHRLGAGPRDVTWR